MHSGILPNSLMVAGIQPTLPAKVYVAASAWGKGQPFTLRTKIYFPFSHGFFLILFCLSLGQEGENDQVPGEWHFYFCHLACYFISQYVDTFFLFLDQYKE